MGGGYKEFLPGAVTIGEVLDHFGYQQVYMQGSKIEFAGTDLFEQIFKEDFQKLSGHILRFP